MTQNFAPLMFASRHRPLNSRDFELIDLALQALNVDHNAKADAVDLAGLFERAWNAYASDKKLVDEFNVIARGLSNAILAMARRRITISLCLNDTPEHAANQIVDAFGLEYGERLTGAISKLLEPGANGAEVGDG